MTNSNTKVVMTARQADKSIALGQMYGSNLTRATMARAWGADWANPAWGADWANPSHPFAMYSEFKRIGFIAGVHAYQAHNKNLTAMGQYAEPVPTLEGKLWFCDIERAIYSVRPWDRALGRPEGIPAGHVILWRRSHRLCDIEQGVAALLMLHERVAIVRSFDAGEKL